MTGGLLIGLVALGLLGLLFFAALADGAVRSLNQVRLRAMLDQGIGRAEAVNRLLDHPHRIASTTLIVNTFALASLAGITAVLAFSWEPFRGAPGVAVSVAILVLGLVVIVFFQLIPRTLAQHNPEATALRISGWLNLLFVVASPVAWMAQRLANAIVRLFGVTNPPRSPFITEDDLKLLVHAGEEEGVIEEEERDMITGILRFGDTAVHEVMVPRPDVIAVASDIPPRKALDVALAAGHSRMPVYSETIDSVRGVVYTKDLIETVMAEEERPLADIARPALFVPETKNLAELLQELQTSKVHMAIVVDEYGGTAGVVTIEDLLEEIVGEIQDEYDVELPEVEQTGPDEWVVLARIDLDDLNVQLGLHLNSEDYDTLGGYITAQLERIPSTGDEVEVEGVRMRVLDTERRRIGRVAIKRVDNSGEEHPPEE